MRKVKIFICLVLVWAMPVSAAALPLLDVEGAVGVWWPSPSGDLMTDGDDRLDLDHDFSFSSETEWFGRIKVDMPLFVPNVYLMANPMKFSDSTIRSFQFADTSFDGDLDTELQLDQYDLAFYYSLPFLTSATMGTVNVDAGLNFRYIDAEASVSGEVSGGGKKSRTEAMEIVIPQVYVSGQIQGGGIQPLDRLSLEAEIRAITYKSDSSYSLLGRVKAKAFGPVFVAGGYRYDAYDINKSDLVVDLNFSGPFVETGLSF